MGHTETMESRGMPGPLGVVTLPRFCFDTSHRSAKWAALPGSRQTIQAVCLFGKFPNYPSSFSFGNSLNYPTNVSFGKSPNYQISLSFGEIAKLSKQFRFWKGAKLSNQFVILELAKLSKQDRPVSRLDKAVNISYLCPVRFEQS